MKYQVTFVKTIDLSQVVEVEAAHEIAAIDLARDRLDEGGWTATEGLRLSYDHCWADEVGDQ